MRRVLSDVLAVTLGLFILVLFAPIVLLCELLDDDDPEASYESLYW